MHSVRMCRNLRKSLLAWLARCLPLLMALALSATPLWERCWDSSSQASNDHDCTALRGDQMPRVTNKVSDEQIAGLAAAQGLSGRALVVAVDRKSVVSGKSVSVRVDLGGRRIIKTTNNTTLFHTPYQI